LSRKKIKINKKVKIICKEHGEFLQTPDNHLCGKGCPHCKSSKGENIIKKYLIENKIEFEEQKRFNECKNKYPLPFDFYLSTYNLLIEFDGEQHFKPYSFSSDKSEQTKQNNLEGIKLRDKIKTNYCLANNIKLLRISYLDKNKIEEILFNYFGDISSI